jgi:DNA-binding FrmR family transcriptional regulator
MKNREIIMRRLERAEGEIGKINMMLNRGGSREQVEESLIVLRESLDDAKAFIQQEPLSDGEINRF